MTGLVCDGGEGGWLGMGLTAGMEEMAIFFFFFFFLV